MNCQLIAMIGLFAAWQSAPWAYYHWRAEHMDEGALPIIAQASESMAGLLLFLLVVAGVAYWKREAIKAWWESRK